MRSTYLAAFFNVFAASQSTPPTFGSRAYHRSQERRLLRLHDDTVQQLGKLMNNRMRTAEYPCERLLKRIYIATTRLTLYTQNTNFDKLLERASRDSGLHAHQRRVLSQYILEQSVFVDQVLQSDGGQKWLEYNGMEYLEGLGYFNSEDLCHCDYCSERIPTNNSTSVYTNGDCDEWNAACSDCVENSDRIFHCELSGRYFDEQYVVREMLDDGCTVCREYGEINDLIEFDSDEEEWTATSPRRTRLLCDYHQAQRPWARGARIPRQAVGVELEIGFAGGNKARNRFLQAHVVPGTGRMLDGAPFCVERDGSLENAGVPGGIEIISDPLSFRDGYQAKGSAWREMLKTLLEHGAEGWKWREHAGIHVNQDVQHVTRETVLKYAIFISNAAALSKFIAGRRKIYNRGNHESEHTQRTKMYSGGFNKKEATSYTALTIAQSVEKAFEDGKYAPVYLRIGGNCIETRIFGSNIRYEGFMACVEYCVAVLDYVQTIETHEVFSPILSSMFRAWLGEHPQKYPNLSARLGVVQHSRDVAVPPTAKISPLLATA